MVPDSRAVEVGTSYLPTAGKTRFIEEDETIESLVEDLLKLMVEEGKRNTKEVVFLSVYAKITFILKELYILGVKTGKYAAMLLGELGVHW